MEGMRQNGERRHLVIGHLALGRVRIHVELALDSQASLRGGCRNQLEDHRIAGERLAAPVLADAGKEAMLNLVPFARSGRQVADRDLHACLISQLLQFPFPQADPRTVASSSIGTDQQSFGRGILLSSHFVPPAADALHGKGRGIMVDADIHPARIASQVIDPIPGRSTQPLHREVVDAHLLGFSLGMPFAPRVLAHRLPVPSFSHPPTRLAPLLPRTPLLGH